MQGPPVLAPWPVEVPARTNGTSVFALVASLSGFVCFVGIGGALGIVLGLVARSEIARAAGRELGRRLANAAIVLGVLNLGVTGVGIAAGVTYLARPRPLTAVRSTPAPRTPARSAPTVSPHTPNSAKSPAVRASRELGTRVTQLGLLTLVDISGVLEPELDKQRAAAKANGDTVILWLVVAGCKPCAGVAAALTNPVTQKALAKVRLVRADRDEFQVELERLGIPTEKIPGFALLDAHNHPLDFIHGGEWDADIAANVAPVLGKFARREYTQRRYPWRSAARDDETSL